MSVCCAGAYLREQVSGPHPLVVGVAKDQFLHRAPADALHEGALDLPDVHARVERGACACVCVRVRGGARVSACACVCVRVRRWGVGVGCEEWVGL